MHSPPTTPLRRLIERAMLGTASEAEVTELAKFAYTIAATRLKQLISSGRLHIQSFNVPLDGIAFDCIAELFERDGDGVFVELASCFEGKRSTENLSDEEVLQCFRQAVFMSIDDGIYRIYRENDPILGRIIRNLKLALQKEPQLSTVSRFGQVHICVNGHHDMLDHLPMYPHHELEQRLTELLRAGESSVSAIHSVAMLLCTEDQYRRIIPLVDVAVVLKRIATRNELPVSSLSMVNESLFEEDITSIVDRAGSVAMEKLRKRYVDPGKMTRETFEQYAAAIHNILKDTFIRNDGSELSQAEYLQRSIQGLSVEAYRASHRSAFEYMVRVAKRMVQQELRELL